MAKRKAVFRTRHKTGKRTVYAKRDRKGRFVDIQSSSTTRDRRKHAKRAVKPGYGWRGDIKKRK